jgi:hypothetical protein
MRRNFLANKEFDFSTGMRIVSQIFKENQLNLSGFIFIKRIKNKQTQ